MRATRGTGPPTAWRRAQDIGYRIYHGVEPLAGSAANATSTTALKNFRLVVGGPVSCAARLEDRRLSGGEIRCAGGQRTDRGWRKRRNEGRGRRSEVGSRGAGR